MKLVPTARPGQALQAIAQLFLTDLEARDRARFQQAVAVRTSGDAPADGAESAHRSNTGSCQRRSGRGPMGAVHSASVWAAGQTRIRVAAMHGAGAGG